MKVELTDQEIAFLREILEQVNVRGVQAKAMLLAVLVKLQTPAKERADVAPESPPG